MSEMMMLLVLVLVAFVAIMLYKKMYKVEEEERVIVEATPSNIEPET